MSHIFLIMLLMYDYTRGNPFLKKHVSEDAKLLLNGLRCNIVYFELSSLSFLAVPSSPSSIRVLFPPNVLNHCHLPSVTHPPSRITHHLSFVRYPLTAVSPTATRGDRCCTIAKPV